MAVLSVQGAASTVQGMLGSWVCQPGMQPAVNSNGVYVVWS